MKKKKLYKCFVILGLLFVQIPLIASAGRLRTLAQKLVPALQTIRQPNAVIPISNGSTNTLRSFATSTSKRSWLDFFSNRTFNVDELTQRLGHPTVIMPSPVTHHHVTPRLASEDMHLSEFAKDIRSIFRLPSESLYEGIKKEIQAHATQSELRALVPYAQKTSLIRQPNLSMVRQQPVALPSIPVPQIHETRLVPFAQKKSFLEKPLTPEEVFCTVRNAIERPLLPQPVQQHLLTQPASSEYALQVINTQTAGQLVVTQKIRTELIQLGNTIQNFLQHVPQDTALCLFKEPNSHVLCLKSASSTAKIPLSTTLEAALKKYIQQPLILTREKLQHILPQLTHPQPGALQTVPQRPSALALVSQQSTPARIQPRTPQVREVSHTPLLRPVRPFASTQPAHTTSNRVPFFNPLLPAATVPHRIPVLIPSELPLQNTLRETAGTNPASGFIRDPRLLVPQGSTPQPPTLLVLPADELARLMPSHGQPRESQISTAPASGSTHPSQSTVPENSFRNSEHIQEPSHPRKKIKTKSIDVDGFTSLPIEKKQLQPRIEAPLAGMTADHFSGNNNVLSQPIANNGYRTYNELYEKSTVALPVASSRTLCFTPTTDLFLNSAHSSSPTIAKQASSLSESGTALHTVSKPASVSTSVRNPQDNYSSYACLLPEIESNFSLCNIDRTKLFKTYKLSPTYLHNTLPEQSIAPQIEVSHTFFERCKEILKYLLGWL